MTVETMVDERREELLEAIVDRASSSAVRFVRFLYCDTSSIIRGKATHVNGLRDRITGGIGLVKGMMAMNLLDQMQTDTGLGATGEIRLVPDLDTFNVLPYSSQSAMMICDMVELDRRPWTLCPRNILKRQIQKAKEMGVEIRAAIEPEFTIGFDEDGRFIPIDRGLCFSTEGMNRGADFINRFANALEAQGVRVEQYYPELGHGQHELSVRHAPALQAADQHIIYRETLRGVAYDCGLVTSLAPKPFANQAGNGGHLHLSVWDINSGRNLLATGDDSLSEFGQQFVAGVLKHLTGLVALTCASVNSYRRLKPRSWSSAYTCWGYENREAAVRVPTRYWGQEEASANIELKCIDNSCNPYIALAAVIAAGLDGVKRKLVPPDPVDTDPSSFNSDEAARKGIRRLPSTLKEALARLLHDALLMEVLGEGFARTYITVKTSEALAFAKNGVEYELTQHRTKF